MIHVFYLGGIAALIVLNQVLLFRYLRIRNARETPTPQSLKLARRISKLPADALPLWADQLLGETGQSFSMWRRSGERAYLDEARTGAHALHSVLTEMLPRE